MEKEIDNNLTLDNLLNMIIDFYKNYDFSTNTSNSVYTQKLINIINNDVDKFKQLILQMLIKMFYKDSYDPIMLFLHECVVNREYKIDDSFKAFCAMICLHRLRVRLGFYGVLAYYTSYILLLDLKPNQNLFNTLSIQLSNIKEDLLNLFGKDMTYNLIQTYSLQTGGDHIE